MNSLNELLARVLLQEPEYQGGLSNHLPMALIALAQMGATDGHLSNYAEAYSRRVSDRPPGAPGRVLSSWVEGRGQIEAYPALLSYFQGQLVHGEYEPTLRRFLPELLPGLGAAAFHGLIRLAYGVLAHHPGEVAAGMAYLAARYLDLGPLPAANGAVSVRSHPREVYQSLHGVAYPLPERGLIFSSMADAVQLPEFAPALASLAIGPSTLADLAQAALKLFNVESNFVALHMVTSCHAMRLLLPYIDDPVHTAFPWLWQAHLAAYFAGKLSRQPRILASGAVDRDFDAKVFACTQAEDDHTIKMVFSCREEAAVYGDNDGVYQLACERVCASYG